MKLEMNREGDAILVVDVQPDFMPGGALPVVGGDEVVEPISRLIVSSEVLTVVATQDWHPPGHASFASSHEGREPFEAAELHGHEQVLWPDHCVQGTEGAALHPKLDTRRISAVIRKGQDPSIDSYSGFRDNHGPGGLRRETGLAGYLRARGVERVWICGLALDVCVAWTALDAVDYGFRVVLLEDLSRAVSSEGKRQSIEEMREKGIVIL